MVLLKRYDEKGFVFFTHANSRKGKEIEQNPYASMLFYWLFLIILIRKFGKIFIICRSKVSRQIRIEGRVSVMEAKIAEDYWSKRPVGSQIGSKISEQSSVVPSRHVGNLVICVDLKGLFSTWIKRKRSWKN